MTYFEALKSCTKDLAQFSKQTFVGSIVDITLGLKELALLPIVLVLSPIFLPIMAYFDMKYMQTWKDGFEVKKQESIRNK